MRKSAIKKIDAKKERIAQLLNEIQDIDYTENLRKAKKEEYLEENRGSKKKPQIVKVKRIYWNETFYDEDYPNDKKHAAVIERSEIIEVEGQKARYGRVLPEYVAADIRWMI